MKNIYIVLISIISLTSCNDENYNVNNQKDTENVASFEDYFKLVNPDTKAGLLVGSVASLGSKTNIYNFSSVIAGNKNSYKLVYEKQLFDVEANNMKKRTAEANNSTLSSLFGNSHLLGIEKNVVNIKPLSNETQNNSEESIYIPELLNAKVLELKNGFVTNGTEVVWNADIKNKRGVIIGVEYRPTNQKLKSIVDAYPKNIIRGSTMLDSGSYKITEKDLSYFPNNAVLTFTIGRANYTILHNEYNEIDIAVGAYTLVRTDFNILK